MATGTGTGTPVTIGEGITFLQLVDRCREALGGGNQGSCEWSRAVVEGWLISAIRDYSMRFPRGLVTVITTVADDRRYDLPSDFLYERTVEYSAYSDPPKYLVKKDHVDAGFWTNDFYDIVANDDANNPDELIIGEKPVDGEFIEVSYLGLHETALGDTAVTVPVIYHDVLVLYVAWQGALARREQSLAHPPENSRLFDRLQKNPFTARLDYFTVLSQANKAAVNEETLAGLLKVVEDDYS